MDNAPKCLEHYKAEAEVRIWLAPIGHPEIEYQVIETEDSEGNLIFFIGTIKGKPSGICEFRGLEIAFIDKENNVISPVLFHDPLTISTEPYQTMLSRIGMFAKALTDTKTKHEEFKPECFGDALYQSFLGDRKLFDTIEKAIYRGIVRGEDLILAKCIFPLKEVIEELGEILNKPEYYEEKYHTKLHAIVEALKKKGVPQGE